MVFSQNRGFTLIELLVVISIIGLLSSVVMSSVNSARKKADNTQRNQIAEEYRKALMLSYDANGGYPYPSLFNTNFCLGDYTPMGAGNYNTLDVCGGSSTGTYGLDEDPTLEAAVAQYLPSLPVTKITPYIVFGTPFTFKGPLYACVVINGTVCTSGTMRWRLQGVGQSCIKGALATPVGDSTLCTLTMN